MTKGSFYTEMSQKLRDCRVCFDQFWMDNHTVDITRLSLLSQRTGGTLNFFPMFNSFTYRPSYPSVTQRCTTTTSTGHSHASPATTSWPNFAILTLSKCRTSTLQPV